MKLSELQEKITPLPWSIPFSPDLIGVEYPDGSRQLVAQTHGKHIAENAAYLAHCANHLPMLVEVLRAVVFAVDEMALPLNNETSRHAIRCARKELTAAEEVEGI